MNFANEVILEQRILVKILKNIKKHWWKSQSEKQDIEIKKKVIEILIVQNWMSKYFRYI